MDTMVRLDGFMIADYATKRDGLKALSMNSIWSHSDRESLSEIVGGKQNGR